MKALKKLFILATIAISITAIVTLTATNSKNPPPPAAATSQPPSGRLAARFLQQRAKNRKAADHCNRENEICSYLSGVTGQNTTCCNNKCIDINYDHNNCGGCKRKCAFTETCCRRECVDLAYDKRHCGYCNHRCMPGGYCIYGMCDYA
ncbi:stigma-specific Stig1 family protein [Striga asiatica]|uniref:Stigma-specific Stig1 family protein n=1 Tax=Striga asiatica TaxID=4170 RepID=A0A5A7P571_STRAF|nr:stigma-specific Stig1 family protein [Striga asiatica]